MPTTILDGETYEQARHRRFTEEAKVIEKMQQDEIIRMARESTNAILFDLIGNPDWDKPCTEKHLLNFANELLANRKIENDEASAIGISIAVLAEREACAKACEENSDNWINRDCAAAIRARSEK